MVKPPTHTISIDRLVRTRRKSIALIIHPDGSLEVRAPLHTSDRRIQELIASKTEWIQTKQVLALTTYSQNKPKTFSPGEQFLFLGQSYPLAIVPPFRQKINFTDKFLLSSSAQAQARHLFEGWYRTQALRIFSERTTWFAQKYGFDYTQVKISSARTRWGSCSSSGTISFTWRLIMAPLSVIDYVIIHELVHTIEQNHQKAFWARVAAIIPDYKQKRAWLKSNGNTLNL